MIVDPTDPTSTYTTDVIPKSWATTEVEFRDYVKEYYSKRISSDISVALHRYADDVLLDYALTEDEVMTTATSVTFIYEVEVLKLRDSSSVSQIYVNGQGVEVLLPVDYEMSLPPNKGNMRIKCVD